MAADGNDAAHGDLPGMPSDQVPAILATGSGGVSTLFLSMARRHPGGEDADYLCWHTLDHRPEQQRLAALATSLRVVSTPACRAVRAAGSAELDDVDHVMTYFFRREDGLADFNALSVALRNAGRAPFILPPVQRGVYRVESRRAAARARLGGDVLPWLPVQGVYLLIESGRAPTDALCEVPGVAGVWSAASVATAFSSAGDGQQLAYCFLDEDPVATAVRLRPVLERRWKDTGVLPLFAAPFHAIVPYMWDRYLP